MSWRIYYDDGSVHDSRDGLPPPGEARYGVLAILQKRSHDGRYHIAHGSDYYFHDGEEWMPASFNGIEDRLAHDKTILCFLVGRQVSKRVFHEVYEQAKKDRASEALD